MADLCRTSVSVACAATLAAAAVAQQLPDLSVPFVSAAGVQGDWQTLQVTGPATAIVANGGAPTAGPFMVAFFEDYNGNGTYEPAIDTLLGSTTVAGIGGGEQLFVKAQLAGVVRFRGNLIHVMADSAGEVTEGNEANNSEHSGSACGAADLTASVLVIPPCTPLMQSLVQARLGNGGSASAGRVPMTFYNNDPAQGGRLIGTVWTARGLAPGQFEDVVLPLPLGFPYGGSIFAVADDQGSLRGTVLECNEVNNIHSVPTCRTNADWSVYGEGFPGTTGIPSIALDARPVIGTTVHLRVENSSGQTAMAVIHFGTRAASIPSMFGGTQLLEPDMSISLRFSPLGTSYPLPIPCDTRLCGNRYYFQALQVDLGAQYGVSFTPGLEMIVGQR